MIFNKTNTDFQVKLRFKASVKDFMADDAFIIECLG